MRVVAKSSWFVGALLASVTLLGSGGAAFAQARDAAGAEALYRRGKEAARAGDWGKACAQFAESQRLDPAPGTLLNLADCEEKRGQLAQAWEHFLQAEAALPRTDSRVAFARSRSKALESRVPRLTVRLANSGTSPNGKVQVRRDDQDLGEAALGVPLPVDPGGHVVIALAEGHKETRVSVHVAEGESREITVTIGPEAQGRAPSPVPPPVEATPASAPPAPMKIETGGGTAPASNGRATLGYVLLGGGAIGLATGTVTGILALSRAGTVKDACGPDYLQCDGKAVDAAGEGKTFATLSTVSFALGAVATGVGLYFLLTPPSSPQRAGIQLKQVQFTAGGASLTGAF